MQTPLTPAQVKLQHTTCPVCEMSELSALDSIAPEAPFLYCPHCETTIDGNGTIERGSGTTEYLYNPDICTSSLDEWGWPRDMNEIAHRWDDTQSPVTCAECGTVRDDTGANHCAHINTTETVHGKYCLDCHAYL